eukprot:1315739-Karenia_brevis.AAC.2
MSLHNCVAKQNFIDGDSNRMRSSVDLDTNPFEVHRRFRFAQTRWVMRGRPLGRIGDELATRHR